MFGGLGRGTALADLARYGVGLACRGPTSGNLRVSRWEVMSGPLQAPKQMRATACSSCTAASADTPVGATTMAMTCPRRL